MRSLKLECTMRPVGSLGCRVPTSLRWCAAACAGLLHGSLYRSSRPTWSTALLEISCNTRYLLAVHNMPRVFSHSAGINVVLQLGVLVAVAVSSWASKRKGLQTRARHTSTVCNTHDDEQPQFCVGCGQLSAQSCRSCPGCQYHFSSSAGQLTDA